MQHMGSLVMAWEPLVVACGIEFPDKRSKPSPALGAQNLSHMTTSWRPSFLKKALGKEQKKMECRERSSKCSLLPILVIISIEMKCAFLVVDFLNTKSISSLPTMTVLRAPTPVSSTSPGPRRGSGPEIFTFDPLPEPAVAPAARPSATRGHRKRSRRVLYPRVVRRQLPVEDPNPAKRLLFILLTIIFCQILMAEDGASAPLAPEDTSSAPSPAPTAAAPVFEPLNLTSEPSDYALDLSTFLQQHPAAF